MLENIFFINNGAQNGLWATCDNDNFIIFKGSCSSLLLQDMINRYLSSRTRPRPRNFSVGVIFDAKKNGRKIFQCEKENRWIYYRIQKNEVERTEMS